MRKILTAALLLVFLAYAETYAQKLDCSKFHNGTFKMSAGGRDYIITRSGTIQTERLEQLNTSMIFNVKWTDDCTYTLTPTKEVLQKYPAMPKNTLMTVRIIKTTKNSYTQTTAANTINKVITCEMVKIK